MAGQSQLTHAHLQMYNALHDDKKLKRKVKIISLLSSYMPTN